MSVKYEYEEMDAYEVDGIPVQCFERTRRSGFSLLLQEEATPKPRRMQNPPQASTISTDTSLSPSAHKGSTHTSELDNDSLLRLALPSPTSQQTQTEQQPSAVLMAGFAQILKLELDPFKEQIASLVSRVEFLKAHAHNISRSRFLQTPRESSY